MKTKILFLMVAVAMVFAGCEKNDDDPANTDENDDEQVDGNVATPPYAATTKTWTFGNQTWSDAIHVPACNKSSFADTYGFPHCCRKTSGAIPRYYYNWEYVNRNAATLCPSPWRMPMQSDFNTLVSNLGGDTQGARNAIIAAWGFGGYVHDAVAYYASDRVYYWSATELSSSRAATLYYSSYELNTSNSHNLQRYGHQVRCVK